LFVLQHVCHFGFVLIMTFINGRGRGGSVVQRRTVSRADNGSTPPAAVSKLRHLTQSVSHGRNPSSLEMHSLLLGVRTHHLGIHTRRVADIFLNSVLAGVVQKCDFV